MSRTKLDRELEKYRARPPTDISDFIDKLSGPLYSWRMASGATEGPDTLGDGTPNTGKMSAETRMDNAQRRIDDLVVAYAVVVLKRRKEEGDA